jgi:hypothetical protein
MKWKPKLNEKFEKGESVTKLAKNIAHKLYET